MEALPGTFGDEGPPLLASIEAMRTGLERWDAALQAYEIAETLELQHARAAEAAAARRLLGGAVYLERGRLDRAVQQFTAAAELDPGRAGVHLFRGLAYEAARKPIEAADAFRQAWTIDPNDPVHAYLLIRHTSPERSEDAQRALKVLQAFQQERQAKQDFRAASPFLHVALVDELPSTEPTFPPARYADGFALVRQGKYEDAIARFREAAATDPLNSSATLASNRVKDGIAALRDGDIMLALGHLTMAIEAAPDSSETHRILGMTYWFDQQYEESLVRSAVRGERSPTRNSHSVEPIR